MRSSSERNGKASVTTRVAARRRTLLIGLMLACVLVLYRALMLQIVEHKSWLARAEDQQADQTALPAPRGTIYDRDGVPLAASDEAFRLNIAPDQVRDRAKLMSALQKHAGLNRSAAQRATDVGKRWVVLPGRFDTNTRERLHGFRGVYFERVLRRFYPRGEIAQELIGAVTADGRALSGLELEFDSLLRGQPGRAVSRQDAKRRTLPGALQEIISPISGNDVFLTIDADLQEIAREALADALERTGAQSGEIVMANPRTGEILAAVSSKPGGRSWRAVTEPYEPGSTLKPFTLAALLAEKRTRLEDSVFAENGEYKNGARTIKDVHAYGWLTVAQALQYSSNIALAKLSDRLQPETQYEYLKAFGFGSQTGITYPSESSGVLRRPASWTKYSRASLAIGYEISVTPLQLLMAYAALANGGVLMQPRLVREVRSRDGRMTTEEPKAVRRAIPERVAEELRPVLADVVTAGTAQTASLGAFTIAGKTGTTRNFVRGRYLSGAYTSSFAGFFPTRDPQLVFLVKLDSPQGDYYGGLTAAPVSRATLEAALAALSTPLDKRAIAADAPAPVPMPLPAPPVRAENTSGPFIFALDIGPVSPYKATDGEVMAALPEVNGLPLRDAVRTLHAAGFRVRIRGRGIVHVTDPAAGVVLPKGALIRVAATESGT
jgi:cell division protein FtsI (penicillin-binding protein 3)